MPNPLLQVVGLAGNPPSFRRVPFRDGQKIPIETARKWVVATGNRDLIRQFNDAYRLQSRANRPPKYAVWRNIAIGDPRKIEMVAVTVDYGTSPETVYKPPRGSKKGRRIYMHKWGEGNRRGSKSVPIIAAPSGKAVLMPLGRGQVVDDWLRG